MNGTLLLWKGRWILFSDWLAKPMIVALAATPDQPISALVLEKQLREESNKIVTGYGALKINIADSRICIADETNAESIPRTDHLPLFQSTGWHPQTVG